MKQGSEEGIVCLPLRIENTVCLDVKGSDQTVQHFKTWQLAFILKRHDKAWCDIRSLCQFSIGSSPPMSLYSSCKENETY